MIKAVRTRVTTTSVVQCTLITRRQSGNVRRIYRTTTIQPLLVVQLRDSQQRFNNVRLALGATAFMGLQPCHIYEARNMTSSAILRGSTHCSVSSARVASRVTTNSPIFLRLGSATCMSSSAVECLPATQATHV